jgi:hypothetical protein
VARDNVTVVDPADPAALGDALEDAVQRASGPLVFYFAGHGLVSEDGRLHLATRTARNSSLSTAWCAFCGPR